jgi:hypothetical protein
MLSLMTDLSAPRTSLAAKQLSSASCRTVRAYFEMLRLESLGLVYNKSERNEQLRSELPARSKSSVELKF